ncbi:MAG: transglycosylase SLT domain-containing protein [Stellaceae bacterium]
MTALSVPVALAIALRCAPAEDPGMLVGIARQESGLETMTLRDDTSGQVMRGAGVIEAARRLIADGHSVDLGPWQINSRNLPLLRLRVADAFEPCKAVAAAARLIELFSRYNTGSRSRGVTNGYVAAVLTAIHAVKAASPARPRARSVMAPLPISALDPFTRPSRTGWDLVFTTKGE